MRMSSALPRAVENESLEEPENPKRAGRTGLVYQLHTSCELRRERDDLVPMVSCRDAICALCEKLVALVLDVPLERMQAKTRQSAEIALARQIAMYLAHTTFSLPLTEVGLCFKRDRSTVAYACSVVEERRDELAFEVMVSQLESLLSDARVALELVNRFGEQKQ